MYIYTNMYVCVYVYVCTYIYTQAQELDPVSGCSISIEWIKTISIEWIGFDRAYRHDRNPLQAGGFGQLRQGNRAVSKATTMFIMGW